MSALLEPLEVVERDGALDVDIDPAKVFEKNPRQALAYKAAISGFYKEILYGGGTGGGKTVVACVIALRKALEIPGCRVLLVRSTISQVRDQFFGELRKIVPKKLIKKLRLMPTPKMELVTGSEIIGLPGEDPEDFKGWNDVHAVIPDEADQCNPLIFPVIFTRFRSKVGSSMKPILFLTCNPSGGFIYERFIRSMDQNPETTVFIPSLAKDNGYIDQKEYIETMREHMTGEEFSRFVEGKWGGLQGSVYPQFQKIAGPWGSHVCAPFKEESGLILDPDRIYQHVQGMDYATRNVTSIVFLAKDVRDGHVYCYDEVWGRGLKLDEIAKQYKEKCDKHGLAPDERFVCGDHNMWTSTDGFSPAASLQYGVPGYARGDDGNPLGQAYSMPLHKADKHSQRYSTASLLLDYSKLSVLTTCPMMIDSLSILEYKKESPTEERNELKAESLAPKGKDAVDALGYALNWCYPPDAPVVQYDWDRNTVPPETSGLYGSAIKRAAIQRELEKENPDGLAIRKIGLTKGDWGFSRGLGVGAGRNPAL